MRVLALGGVGYAFQASLFYAALQRGTAAAVALLFYAYPALVTGVEMAVARQRPTGRLSTALGLSVAGTLLIVLSGGHVSITPAGTGLALAAAAAFGLYLLVGAGAAPRTSASAGGAMVIGAWVAAGAAVSLSAVGAASGGLRWPGEDWWLMIASGLATACAFVLLFAALERLGASRTSVVMTLEALSAVVLGALLLDERLGPVQLIGGLAILAATVLVSTAGAPAPAAAAPHRDPPVNVVP